MPRTQLKILVALVMVLIIGGIGAFSLSQSQAQVAVQASLTSTSTETPIPTAQNTVIPSDSTFVPMPTPVHVQTRIGPTLTPSGPLINFEGQNTQRLQDHFPKQLGGLDFIVAKDPWAVGGLGAEHQYGANQRLGIEIRLGESSQLADATYIALLLRNNFKNPQPINVGDEAIVDTQHTETIGLMRFRNAVVEVLIFSFNGQADPPISEQTLIQILEDIEQFLEKESLDAVPSPTQIATVVHTATLKPTPHTPTDQPLGGSLEEVRRIMANAPKTVGGLPLAVDPMPTSMVETVMSFQNTDGTTYFITVNFGHTGKDFERGINLIKSPPSTFRVVDLADETLLLEGSRVLILMRYRNVFVRLERPDPRPSAVGPTPVPLTEDQLIAIMTDLYTYLSKQ
ncbi:MAG: hypothetical protein KF716_09940 [Anaerolineae bacterium]|nr:hypothetical protein [Anaerolineae bacterium]